jgi:hypothetical protein
MFCIGCKKLGFCSMISVLSILTLIFSLLSMVVLQNRTIEFLRANCNQEEPHQQSFNAMELQNQGHHIVSERSTSKLDNLVVTSKSMPNSVESSEVRGVAFTLFLGSPKWFQNRYAMMINLLHGALPKNWVIQIFFLPHNKMSNEAVNHPGIQKQVKKGNVILVPIPDSYAKFKKRELMMLPWLWKQLRAERVLTFGGTNVLCSNSPFDLEHDFHTFDFIGSPSRDFNGFGGDGGISLRNRTTVLAILSNEGVFSEQDETTNILKSMIQRGDKIANPEETRAFGLNDGTQNFEIDWNPEHLLKYSRGSLPLGAQGTLGGLSDVQRTKALEYCPELKIFFPVLHSGACFGASPRPLECFKFLCEDGGLRCDEDAAVSEGIEYLVNRKKDSSLKGKLSIKIGSRR